MKKMIVLACFFSMLLLSNVFAQTQGDSKVVTSIAKETEATKENIEDAHHQMMEGKKKGKKIKKCCAESKDGVCENHKEKTKGMAKEGMDMGKEKMKKAKDGAEKMAKDGMDMSKEKMKTAKDGAEKMIKEGEKEVKDVMDGAKEEVKKTKDKIMK